MSYHRPAGQILTKRETSCLELFAKRARVSTDDLIDLLYGDDPDGGPNDVSSAVKVIICKVRKAVKPLGITITTYDRPGRGGGYCWYGMSKGDQKKAQQFLARRVDIVLGDAPALEASE